MIITQKKNPAELSINLQENAPIATFMNTRKWILSILLIPFLALLAHSQTGVIEKFTQNWKFALSDNPDFSKKDFNDANWRNLNLPHDWSIEGAFDKDNPATPSGGALPGGIGWYRKTFTVPAAQKGKLAFIDFDGIYWNSEVWINGHYLGKRPNGYISFRYELTPYLKFGKAKNVIAVKVDNSQQPNSRWYSGSGIYRNVWLVFTNKIHVNHWGTSITTPEVSAQKASIAITTKVVNADKKAKNVTLQTLIYDQEGKEIAKAASTFLIQKNKTVSIDQNLAVANPILWSIEKPHLYKAVSKVWDGKKLLHSYETNFGIRYFHFDAKKGFSLNGKPTKILGVCNHHDLGCLGAATNTRAIERQLEIMKKMGVNAIRTTHNPPAPELLDLCDKMGFIVMDEAFDMWKKKKIEFGYSLYYDEWHQRDLEDMILRDRNHPSIMIWSIGNEILEQWDSTGIPMTRELANIIKKLDPTRPITAGLNPPSPDNNMVKSGALDLIGYNYDHRNYEAFPNVFPGKIFISTEAVSALATRGHYDMPSDSIRRWPIRWDLPFKEGNPGNTVSAYDNVSAPWGSTHEETWKVIKKYDYLSGLFIWTGFDYLGEPTPYDWPSRSSYFGIVDLAGFPKDSYYMYQSEWTNEPVLHIFPHWNWEAGKEVDVWAYSNSEEVELFLNGKSLGVKRKSGDDLHLMWRLNYTPGTLNAIARTGGKEIVSQEVKTAGAPAKIILQADRSTIKANGEDLSFITVRIEDADGNLVPHADNLVNFKIEGAGFIAGVDNGSQTSHEPFKASYRKAFNGLCLAVLQSLDKPGTITLTATAEGLKGSTIEIQAK